MIQCEKVRMTTNALRQIRLSLSSEPLDKHQQNLLDSLLDECKDLLRDVTIQELFKGVDSAIQK